MNGFENDAAATNAPETVDKRQELHHRFKAIDGFLRISIGYADTPRAEMSQTLSSRAHVTEDEGSTTPDNGWCFHVCVGRN